MSYHNQPTEFLPRLVATGKLRHEAGSHSRNQMRMRTKEPGRKRKHKKREKQKQNTKAQQEIQRIGYEEKVGLEKLPT